MKKSYLRLGSTKVAFVQSLMELHVLRVGQFKFSALRAFIEFRNERWIDKPVSAYDCTGRPFTRSIDLLHYDTDRDVIIVRHIINFDV